MYMIKNIQNQIEEIINGFECPKDFICYRSGLEELCRVRDIGLESFLVCLESHTLECKFSLYYGRLYFCQCQLRIYIAKKLGK